MPRHLLVQHLKASPIDIDDEGPPEDLSKKLSGPDTRILAPREEHRSEHGFGEPEML